MSLATGVAAGLTSLANAVKTLTVRVTAVEQRTQTVVLTQAALSIVSGVVNIDCALGDMFTLALTANVTSVTFTNLPAAGFGAVKSVLVQQPLTGGPYTLALPASFKAVTGTDTAIQTAAGARTELGIKTYDQGTRWAFVMKGVAA